MKFKHLEIDNPQELVFGKAKYPVTTKRGLVIGGGTVYPELNFTLPPMSVTQDTYGEVKDQYREIISSAIERARELHQEGVIFEFETLLEMTSDPSLGRDIVAVIHDLCEKAYQAHGFKSEIRLTPNDLRDLEKPLKMRTGRYLEPMFELFEQGALAGGDLLSIESTGGKELCDYGLMHCDIKAVTYALSVLGVRDMQFLWSHIVNIADKTRTIPAGDTACGFANTAMVLADKHYIPKVFAAAVRVLSVVRTLVALEQGALGPDKDCGYEGPFLKAITGRPISMEGRSSACAHFSPLGNIAGSCCDLWSNESVSNVKLLSGMAPTVSMEQLIYDARLFNQASASGYVHQYISMMNSSDMYLDPQALILHPEHVVTISREIVSGKNYIDASVRGALTCLDIIKKEAESGNLLLEQRELPWIDMIRDDLISLPHDESAFTESLEELLIQQGVQLSEYGL